MQDSREERTKALIPFGRLGIDIHSAYAYGLFGLLVMMMNDGFVCSAPVPHHDAMVEVARHPQQLLIQVRYGSIILPYGTGRAYLLGRWSLPVPGTIQVGYRYMRYITYRPDELCSTQLTAFTGKVSASLELRHRRNSRSFFRTYLVFRRSPQYILYDDRQKYFKTQRSTSTANLVTCTKLQTSFQ
jgi:hypothetical protein